MLSGGGARGAYEAGVIAGIVGILRGERLRRTAAYPSPFFILGKVLNALLLDPINYDLGVMRRFNRLWGVLEATLTDEEMHRVTAVLEETRGASYRRLEALVFHPSQDIGDITTRHAKRLGARSLPGAFVALSALARAWLLSRALTDTVALDMRASRTQDSCLERCTLPGKLRKRRTASNCDVPPMRRCSPLSS